MGERCRIELVDGEPVRVQGASEWDDADRAAFAEVIQAAKRRYVETHCATCGRRLPDDDPNVAAYCSPRCYGIGLTAQPSPTGDGE